MVFHGITDIDPEHDLDEAPFWSGSPTMCQTGIPDAGGAGDLSIFPTQGDIPELPEIRKYDRWET